MESQAYLISLMTNLIFHVTVGSERNKNHRSAKGQVLQMCIICERIEMIKKGTNPYFVKELDTGYVVLGDHQHFTGYTLFLLKEHQTELFDLESSVKARFLEEMTLTAKAVSRAFGAEKMNYECLGNGDAHIHWHLFPRITGDLGEYGNNGKGPVWWYPMEKMYSEDSRPDSDELEAMKQRLRKELEKLS